MYHFLFLLVFHMLSCLFIADFWSPAVNGLIYWLFLVMFIVFLLLVISGAVLVCIVS